MSSVAIKRRLFAVLPTPVRVQGRAYLRNCLLDLRDYLGGRGDRDIPPHRLNISGGGPFRLYGETTVAACREYAGLQPGERFIDIGCGIGRTALALTDFLLPSTSYLGFDVIGFAVKWCTRHISTRYPNFRFVHSDVHNWVYNPRGGTPPERYHFPARDGEFQFALANSLFTHLGPEAATHYVGEANRVLDKSGRFLSSWFVLDQKTQLNGVAATRFPHRIGPSGYASLHAPEQAVAFERDWIEQTFRHYGFSIEGIHRGNWSGLGPGKTFQDLVVAIKG
jgi:SAM-dependent methyltransferase